MTQYDADICLILEGSYPYVSGGLSTWTHDLIKHQKQYTFHLLCLLPPDYKGKSRYELPENVTGVTNVYLQKLPSGDQRVPKKLISELYNTIETPLLNLQVKANLKDLEVVLDAFKKNKYSLGRSHLLDSEEAWNAILRMYRSTMWDTGFLNYFWSWRTLLGGLYSVTLTDYPRARLYHALCTGYAGLFLTRARLETGNPCVLTEHGIYTNERRIEITAADWLEESKTMSLGVDRFLYERDLKDFWIDTFSGYSRMTYQASDVIITLYEGNQDFQKAEGADPEKMRVIPNGIEIDDFSGIKRNSVKPPTVALIGRPVPIKDVKTYIRAISQLKEKIPGLRAWLLGGADEDEDYYEECLELVQNLELEDTFTFKGQVNVKEYLSEIDVIVLTSLSEVQPMVILESGAVGIPTVATDVGACREMLYGRSDETPQLGQGGEICDLADPIGIAEAIANLLIKTKRYDECSYAIKERISTYYKEEDQQRQYKEIYSSLLAGKQEG